MAFNRNDPNDLAAFKNEVENNPRGATGLGDPTAPTQQILTAMNLASENPTIPELGKPYLFADEFWIIRSGINLGAQSQPVISDLFALVEGLGSDISEFHAQLSALDNSLANALAARDVQISIAQSLFADGLFDDPTYGSITEEVTLTAADWYAARDS
jgi:hypothetical protein